MLINFRLKRLQVMDILEHRDVFYKLNFSVSADDFIEVSNMFTKEFFPGSLSIVFHWIDEYIGYCSEIITPWGLCFTYNIGFSHDLLNINLTSDDFHYEIASKREVPVRNQRWFEFDNPPKDLPQMISSSKVGLWVGFDLTKSDINKINNNTFQRYTILLHDPLELPSANSKILHLNVKYQTTIWIDPQQNSIDESLVEYEPAE